LGNNELEGTIPDIFKKMKHLVALDLHKNKLVGRLPSSISRLLSLEHLLLDHNALTGWLPTTLFSLARLRTMVLHHNKFYGSIPWEIGGLVQLHDLWLDHNVSYSTTTMSTNTASRRSPTASAATVPDTWRLALSNDRGRLSKEGRPFFRHAFTNLRPAPTARS